MNDTILELLINQINIPVSQLLLSKIFDKLFSIFNFYRYFCCIIGH